jgi:hypothetical protein
MSHAYLTFLTSFCKRKADRRSGFCTHVFYTHAHARACRSTHQCTLFQEYYTKFQDPALKEDGVAPTSEVCTFPLTFLEIKHRNSETAARGVMTTTAVLNTTKIHRHFVQILSGRHTEMGPCILLCTTG